MTDETNNKLRAVFLAALMVLWVFAGTVALAGSAAAIEGDTSDIENADVAPQRQNTDQEDVTYETSFEFETDGTNEAGGAEVVLTDASGGTSGGSVQSGLSPSDVNVTFANGTNVNVSDVAAVDNDDDGTDDSVQIEFENDIEPDDGQTLLVDLLNIVNNPAVEDTYDAELRSYEPGIFSNAEFKSDTAEYTIDDAAGGDTDRERRADATFGGGDTRFKGQNLFFNANTNGGNIDNYQLNLYTPGDRNGGEEIGALITEITLNSSTQAVISTSNVPDNERVVITAQGTDRSGTTFSSQAIVEVDDNGNQNGFDDGRGDGNSSNDAVTVVPQTLQTNFTQDSEFANTNTTLEVDSNRDGFDLFVDSDDLSQSGLASAIQEDTETDIDTDRAPSEDAVRVEGLNSFDDLTFNFDSTGNFSFEFSPTDTDVTSSAQIEIVEEPDADATFVTETGTFTVNRGDVQSPEGDNDSTISIETTDVETATVRIGSEDRNNYATALVIEPNEDDEIEIRMNTFLAGNLDSSNVSRAFNVTEGNLVTISRSTDRLPGVLDRGSYDLIVENRQTEEELEAGVLRITEANYNELNQLRPPATRLSNADEVGELATNEDLSETDIVTLEDTEDDPERDLLIYEVDITGVFGALDLVRQEETGADSLEDANGNEILRNAQANGTTSLGPLTDTRIVNATLAQTNEVQNTEPKTQEFNVSDSDGFEFVIDEDNETLYLVTDISELELTRNSRTGTSDEPVEIDDKYNFTFEVASGYSNLFEGGIDEETAGGDERVEVEVQDREAQFDTDSGNEIRVNPGEGQEISGESNVAPGTQLTIAVTNQGPTRRADDEEIEDRNLIFLREPDVVVQDDGSFSSEFDFSGIDTGTNFTAFAQRAAISDQAETDGLVVQGRPAEVSISDVTASVDVDEVSTVTVDSGFLPQGGFVTIHDGTLQDGATFDSVRGKIGRAHV